MKYLILILLAMNTLALSAQPKIPSDKESEIRFSINNLGLSTKGSISGLSGTKTILL